MYRAKLYKFLFATSLGTFLEFFDLALYSFCSALIAKNFFPEDNATIAIILTWAIFAISYLIRPLGAIWFGHIADTNGGKRAMLISMVLMSIATCAIGLIPTYSSIGIMAPLLLLLCRITQSIAVSPEYNLASVFIKNNAWCEKHYGFVSSISASVTGFGMLSANWVMSRILSDVDVYMIPEYKWRLPFIVAGILVGTIGIYFRWNIPNSDDAKPQVVPLRLVLQKQPKDFLHAFCIAGYIGCITYALFSFLGHQLQVVRGMPPGNALSVLGSGVIVLPLFSLLAGFFSDFMPRHILMLIAAFIIITSGYTLFSYLNVVSEHAIWIQSMIMLAGLGFFAGSFPGYLAEIFAKPYRYTGSFLAYNLGMSWIGGVSPLLFISLSELDKTLPILLIVSYSLLIIWILVKPIFAFGIKQTDVV